MRFTVLKRLFKCGIIGVSCFYIAIYIFIALSRISYPYELEWMEGGAVDHVIRVLKGETIYPAPSLEFLPYVYTPLYHYVAAFSSLMFGIGFFSLRLPSFLSSLVCLYLLYLIVRNETGDSPSGILATGLFAGSYRITGAWLDISRPDSLFLALLLGAFYLIRNRSTPRTDLVAGLLLAAALLTKQTTITMAAPLGMALLITETRRAIRIFAVFGIISAIGIIILHVTTHGWFTFYTFQLPRYFSIRILQDEIYSFWTRDLLFHLPVAASVALLLLITLSIRDIRQSLFFWAVTLGSLVGSWLPRMQYGGYDNTLIPAYAIISILFGMGIHTLLPESPTINPVPARLRRMGLSLLVMLQFHILNYNITDQIPAHDDRMAGDRLQSMLRHVDGDAFVPYHGYLPSLAGHPSFAHQMQISDMLGCAPKEISHPVARDITDALEERRFSMIILDQDTWFFQDILDENYELVGPVFQNPDVFWPVTGWRIRPKWIYRRKGWNRNPVY